MTIRISRLLLATSLFAMLCLSCGASTTAPRRVSSCSALKHEYDFLFTAQGALNQTVGTVQGPQCIQVALDTVRFDALISINESVAAGKDLSSFLISGAPAIGGGGLGVAPDPLQSFQQNYSDFQIQLQNVNAATASLKTFISTIDSTLALKGDTSQTYAAASAYYNGSLRPSLLKLQTASRKLYATDLPDTSICPAGASLSSPLPGSQEFQLADFKTKQTAKVAADQALLDAAKAKQKADVPANQAADQPTIDSAQAALDKDTTDLGTVNGYIAFADQYKCNATAFVSLTKQLQALAFWITRLGTIGFTEAASGGTPSLLPLPGQLASGLTKDFFVQAYQVSCQNLLNSITTDAFSISTADQLPMVDGNVASLIPSSGAPPTFITVSCASPVSVSAGLEISGIPDQEYAIVQSKDPAGGASPVPQFNYTQNSPFHLLPIGMAHFRIKESEDLRFGFHASVGISGNLQGSGSGGSTAEYLFGGSFSFLRIVYLTAGAHLGYKSVLGGGYSVGDTAPSSITNPQVNKTAAVRYGFAITFSKP